MKVSPTSAATARLRTLSFAVLLAATATGCSSIPQSGSASISIPEHYRHASAATPAEPADVESYLPLQANWWSIFNDPLLDSYQVRAQQASPNLQAALARLQQAQAQQLERRSAFMPSLAGSVGSSRERASEVSPAAYNQQWIVGADIAFF